MAEDLIRRVSWFRLSTAISSGNGQILGANCGTWGGRTPRSVGRWNFKAPRKAGLWRLRWRLMLRS